MTFEPKNVIASCAWSGKEERDSHGKVKPIFTKLLEKIIDYSHIKSYTVKEMKANDPKKRSGFAWEKFCQTYLIHASVFCGKRKFLFEEVWLLKETPQDVKEKLGLLKQDIGIDLIAKIKTNDSKNEYVAIQAKFREPLRNRVNEPPEKYVSWKELSTFWALVKSTNVFSLHLVMTNCKGISWKAQKKDPKKDKVLAYFTFLNTPQELWLKMAETKYYTLNENVEDENYEECAEEGSSRNETKSMREARLKYFLNEQSEEK